MMLEISKRFKKLDETLSLYTYCKYNESDVVLIRMSIDVCTRLLAESPLIMTTANTPFEPYIYKGFVIEFVNKPNYLAVTYYNKTLERCHNTTEIKEEDT